MSGASAGGASRMSSSEHAQLAQRREVGTEAGRRDDLVERTKLARVVRAGTRLCSVERTSPIRSTSWRTAPRSTRDRMRGPELTARREGVVLRAAVLRVGEWTGGRSR
jgi:hypothetical protein